MTGQRAVVAEDDVIANYAIVRDVRVRQEIAVRSDSRVQPVSGRGMHGGVFPEDIPFPDFEVTLPAIKFQVLRLQSNARERKKLIPRTDRGQPIDHHV
jgi:hypothetical protein